MCANLCAVVPLCAPTCNTLGNAGVVAETFAFSGSLFTLGLHGAVLDDAVRELRLRVERLREHVLRVYVSLCGVESGLLARIRSSVEPMSSSDDKVVTELTNSTLPPHGAASCVALALRPGVQRHVCAAVAGLRDVADLFFVRDASNELAVLHLDNFCYLRHD